VADYPPDPLPGIIPGGGISIIAGASGLGKTAFLAWWTTRFRDNLPIFGHPVGPFSEQVILAIDRSWVQSTSKWFEVAEYANIRAYSPLDDPSFRPARARSKQHRLSLLIEFLDKFTPAIPPHALVYVDPLSPFLGGNLNDYDSCMVACMEIRELCRQRQITIIGTAHTAKLKGDPADRYTRVVDRILGSAALLGYTDTQMYLAGPDETEGRYYEFTWNPHHAPQATFPLDRDKKSGLFIPPGTQPRDEEELAIVKYLKDQPEQVARFADIVAAIALPKATIHRHLQALVKDGLVHCPAKGFYKLRTIN
jgi:hypothetical protein